MVFKMFMLLIGFLSLPVFAEDDGKAVQSMLDAIPEIEGPKVPVQEAPAQPQEPQGMDLDAYLEACRSAVYAHFKMPKKIVKSSPGVEIAFLVTVDAEGRIQGVTSPKRSGHRAWDAAALAALNKVGRLPVPPAGWNVTLDKVLIPFNKDSK